MATNCKVVFFFNQGRWGWTETYYWSSAYQDLKTCLNDAEKLAMVRIPLLAKYVSLEAIRVSDLGNKRSAYSEGTGILNVATTNLGYQEPWEAALISVAGQTAPTGPVYKRSIMLRGLPGSWNNWTILAAGSVIPDQLRDALTPFLTALRTTTLLGAQWCVRGSNRDTTQNPVYDLLNIGVSQPGSFFTVTPGGSPPIWPQGQLVHLGKAKGYGLGGFVGDGYLTQLLPLGAYQVSRRQSGPATPVIITKPGTIQLRSPILVPIVGTSFMRFTKRDTGRAFFVTRGRQRAKPC